MNGLETIKERILADARESVAEIMDRTDRQIGKIIAEGESRAQELKNEALAEAEKNVQALLKRARSKAELEKRRALLQARRKLVDQVIDQALDRLCSLPAEDKIEIYLKTLQAVDDGRAEGEIVLAARDQHLGQTIADHFSGRLKISTVPGSFSGGVILRKGQIAENMSLEMIARKNRSELVQVAAQYLFASPEADDGVKAQ